MIPDLWSDLLRIATLLAALVCVAVLLVLSYKSRHWTGPANAARMDMYEAEQRIIRGNQHRIERDLGDWRREMLDVNERILNEIGAIKTNGAKQHPLSEEIEEIRDRVFELERDIKSLPCANREPEPCSTKEK